MSELIKDENGKLSASRVVLFLFCLLFIAGLFGPVEFSPAAHSTIGQVILLTLGAAGVRSAIKNSR